MKLLAFLSFIVFAVFLSGCISQQPSITTRSVEIPTATNTATPTPPDTNITIPSPASATITPIVAVPKPTLDLTVPMIEENMRWRKFPIHIFIDNKTCSNQEYDIRTAIYHWNKNVIASFEVIDAFTKDSVVVKCYDETESFYLDKDDYVHQKVGEALPLYSELGDFKIIEGGYVNIYRTTRACSMPVRYIHEFGHILSLNHTTDETDIMYPYEDCSQTIKPETKDTLQKLYSDEVNNYVEYLYKTNSSACPVNTTVCSGRCLPQCSENYTLVCDNIEPKCTLNWTKISKFDWAKFDESKINCYGELYPPCEGNQIFICEYYSGAVGYCMNRDDFERAAWWAKCSESYTLYCGSCQLPCLGTAYCDADKYKCVSSGNKP